MSYRVNLNVSSTKVTNITKSCNISSEVLLNLVRRHSKENIPDNAVVFVNVPGGGDYSNTALTIVDDVQITIQWKETEVKED